MSKRKQPGLGYFGFMKQTKTTLTEDNEAPVTASLPEPLVVAVAAADSSKAASAPDTPSTETAATCITESGDTTLPLGWTKKQWSEWKNRNTWLFSKNQKLGCTVCMEAKSLLLAEKAAGVHLSEEWMNGDVSSESQNNLRKKI